MSPKYHKMAAILQTVCSWVSNQQYSCIGAGHGLAWTRQQAIIWTNDVYFTDAYKHHSSSIFLEVFVKKKLTTLIRYYLQIQICLSNVFFSHFGTRWLEWYAMWLDISIYNVTNWSDTTCGSILLIVEELYVLWRKKCHWEQSRNRFIRKQFERCRNHSVYGDSE